jgi:hypothetical protein
MVLHFFFRTVSGECIGEASSSDFDDDDGGKDADDDDDVGEMRKSTSTSFLTFFLWISKFMKFHYVPKLNSTFRS